MLRITVHDEPKSLTFQLEGRLAGPWVQELEACWQGAAEDGRRESVRFDLSAVTFVDGPGKEFLTSMHARGAELIATGCLMKAIVAEIGQAPFLDCGAVGGAQIVARPPEIGN
jgi:hypothetical protein